MAHRPARAFALPPPQQEADRSAQISTRKAYYALLGFASIIAGIGVLHTAKKAE